MSSTTSSKMDCGNPSLEQHMRIICPECGIEFSTQHAWRTHLNEDHNYLVKTAEDFNFKEINERYHECQVCHTWVANAHQAIALLQYHNFLHLPYPRTYHCRHCPGAFTRKRALCEHIYRFHQRLLEKPQRSQNAATDRYAQTKMLRNPKTNVEFYLRCLCPQCGKLFEQFEPWRDHINTAHHCTSTDLRMHRVTATGNYYCLQCKKLFYTSDKTKLQRHRFTHLPYKMYFQCAFCSVRKMTKSDVLLHFAHGHPQEYAAAKEYIKLPVEWGGVNNLKTVKELKALLQMEESAKDTNAAKANKNKDRTRDKDRNKDKDKQTDLIQKALLESLIDLETETKNDALLVQQPTNKSANEYALDQSLTDLEAILRGEIESDKKSHAVKNRENSNNEHRELEELCAELFEEIEKDDQMLPFDEIKTEIKLEESDYEYDATSNEQIIKIEIDAVHEDEAEEARAFQSPNRKRIKLTEPEHNNNNEQCVGNESDKLKLLLEAQIHYLCPECGIEFKQQPPWREHVFAKHNLANAIYINFQLLENKCSYLCLNCMGVLQTIKHSELQRHHFMHMPFQAYLKCTLCQKTKSSKPKMVQHLQTHHQRQLQPVDGGDTASANAYQCYSCDKKFKTQGRWQNHRAQCTQRSLKQHTIVDNIKLLAHLKQAHARIRKLAATISVNEH